MLETPRQSGTGDIVPDSSYGILPHLTTSVEVHDANQNGTVSANHALYHAVLIVCVRGSIPLIASRVPNNGHAVPKASRIPYTRSANQYLPWRRSILQTSPGYILYEPTRVIIS